MSFAQMEKQLRAIETVVQGYDNNPVTDKYKVAIPDGSDSLEFFPAKGYGGNVWLMVGFNMQGEIQRVVVVEHKETPGLGSKMLDSKFLNQYLSKNPGTINMKVKKDGGSIDAITGATISSRAFSEAVQMAYETFQSMNYGNASK
jgi:electron transport complex protein RnfG